MKELIPIQLASIENQTVNTVSARDLHAFLEVGKDFSAWIKAQIDRARLVENRDFIKLTQKGELSATGQIRIEYYLTIEAAKHIGMMSGTEKGFQVRDYFIECERIARAKAADPMELLNDPAAMRGLLLTYTEKVLALEEEKRQLAPKAEALDRIAFAEGLHCITDTAKQLQLRPKELFALMSAERWIYRRPGGRGWVAYQDKIQQGLLTHKVTTVTDQYTGHERIIEHVLVTPKGLTKLASKFQQPGGPANEQFC